VSDQAPPALSLDDVRRQGGPLLDEVRAGIDSAVAGGATSLAEAFNTLPAELRRPVEVFGLAYLASQGRLSAAQGGGVVEAVRADGSRRAFELPPLRPGMADGPPSAVHAAEPHETGDGDDDA
jgi:hypothetical protein